MTDRQPDAPLWSFTTREVIEELSASQTESAAPQVGTTEAPNGRAAGEQSNGRASQVPVRDTEPAAAAADPSQAQPEAREDDRRDAPQSATRRSFNDGLRHAIMLCEGEKVGAEDTNHESDIAYNTAIKHCVERINIELGAPTDDTAKRSDGPHSP